MSYFQYYSFRLKIREILENLDKFDNNKLKCLSIFKLESTADIALGDAFEPTKNLLFLLRNNYDYLLKVISLYDDNPIILSLKEEENKNTLIDLFCHQFYDNILIPNPEHQELLILIYLLIEREVSAMNSASVDSFLNDSIFIGKFLTSYTKKQEFKSYLSMALSGTILSIERKAGKTFELNPSILNSIELKNKKSKRKGESPNNSDINPFMIDFDNYLMENVPKCSIQIKKNSFFQREEEEENKIKQRETEENALKRRKSKKRESREYDEPLDDNKLELRTMSNIHNKEYKLNYNNDYFIELELRVINKRIQSENDPNLKVFYKRQLERISRDKRAFTNQKFKNSLEEYSDNKIKILIEYKNNFLIIKEKIDEILQTLIDKISTFPYTLRCICKIIYMLISKKFNNISLYEKNSFVGAFIFGKLILPILINCNSSGLITSTILSINTLKCLKIIAKVLTRINNGLLFESNIDTDFTIFNHYIIEVIPLINIFYSKLIDVTLPKALNDLINFRFEKGYPLYTKPNIFTTKKYKEKIEEELITPSIGFSYFDENPEEPNKLQCICFSFEDIEQLIKLIKDHVKEFSNFPKFKLFEKSIERIIEEENIFVLGKGKRNVNIQERKFFLIYQGEENDRMENKRKISRFELTNENNQHSELFLKNMKFCIKRVLKGLNIINSKDYSYLNYATTTKNFFLALLSTLEEILEISDNLNINEIPLQWYSQYIWNNRKMLSEEYQSDDYGKLYSEMLEEEEESLNSLKMRSNAIMTRNGMNLGCAENVNERARGELYRVEQMEKFVKIEKFIKEKIIKVCISLSDKEEKKGKSTKCDSSLEVIIKEECVHNQLEIFDDYILENLFHKSAHPRNIEEFAKTIEKYKQIKMDVISGRQVNKIYNFIDSYLNIVRTHLENSKDIFINITQKDINENLDKIEDYIMKKIYPSVFPNAQSKEDNDFLIKTKTLSWIKPKHLDIKQIYENELEHAREYVKQLDEKTSIDEKLGCIAKVYKTINNTVKFCSEKGGEAGSEILSPLFQYIIIKAQPKRFITNINYIKAFLNPKKYHGFQGFLLTQMEFAAEFILNINYTSLKITNEEYEENMRRILSN